MMNVASNPKLGLIVKQEQPMDCSCLIGTPYIENGVCKCANEPVQTTPTGVNVTPRAYGLTSVGAFEKLFKQYLQQPTQTSLPVPSTSTIPDNGIVSSITGVISEHPVIVGGVVLLLGYMFLSGGLSATDRTITSVTRFAPKSKK
jgi:hypothetical protein